MSDAGRCTQCGQKIQPRQNFCVSCGAAVVRDVRAAADPFIGRVLLDKYEVEEVIGAGSMGVVYRANHTSLGNDVAIKVLRRRLVSDKTVVRRFKQEARAASRLNHPNTIQILDFGELDGGELFMVMEYIEGRDFSALIQQEGPLPPARIAHIVTQVCSALYEAHDAGIVHRDLKPANILVANLRSQRDFVNVLDFGIAKMLDPDPSQSIPMTRDGFVCGTPAFMSPEQVQGMELDGRSDLFALGVCLYQALTGKLPFKAPTPLELATALVTEDPTPPQERRPEWNPDPVLSEVCLKALRKLPEDRYGSALEMMDALAAARSDSSRALMPAVDNDGDVIPTEPDMPAVVGDEDVDPDVETRRRAPALTPADSPNRAHLDLPPAERLSDDDPLATVEMARLVAPVGRRKSRKMVMLALAALIGFALVTWALDRLVPPASDKPVISPAPAPAATAPPATEPPASPQPRVVGVPAKRAATKRPIKSSRKPAKRQRAAPPPTAVSAPKPAKAAPNPDPKADKMAKVRQLHAEASKAQRGGDQKGALKLLRQAVTMAPRYAPVHRDLGKIYMRRNDRKKAVAHYKRYLELMPNASDAKTYRTIIKRFE